MKKYFLSSMLVMGLMAPAFGADGKITGGAGTCTVDVLGVYDNNATANTIATWALNDYDCGAGQYLVIDDGTIACQPCPAGSYCPGGTYTVENADEGTNACPTGYAQSDAGASVDTQCYTDCKVSDIAHATAVTGNDYYGSGTDTCTATDCEFGYHVDGELEIYEKTPVVPVDYNKFSMVFDAIDANGEEEVHEFEADFGAGLTENNTWANKMGDDIVYGRASCQSQRHNEELQQILEEYAAQVQNGTMTLEEYQTTVAGLTDPVYAKYSAEWLKLELDILSGNVDDWTDERITELIEKWLFIEALSNRVFDADYSTNSSGKYCYCQITEYKPVNGNKEGVVSAPWVLAGSHDRADDCAFMCALNCSGFLGYNRLDYDYYLAALFDAMDYRMSGGMCKITENNCPAGQYLAVVGDAMMCVPCKSGSYCPGGVYTIESENKGTNACPSGYPNSDAGAGADTQCYKACTLETANIAHATAVSGNDYYGTGTDTCSATECVKGYHTDAKMQFVEKTPAVNVDFNSINGVAVIDGTGWTFNENLPNSGLTENNTIAVSFTNGIMYGRASCQPEMDAGMEYMMNNMNAVMDGSMSVEDFRSGMTAIAGATKAEFAVEYVNALKSGNMTEEESAEWEMKLTAVFLANKNANYTTSSAGKYCYFQVNGFAPSGGTKSDIVGLPWMLFPEPFESDEECASNCIMSGAESVLQFAPIALGALDYAEISTCAANTINIDWNPDNGGAHTQNMCLYDGAITLPTPDPVKPGYVFSGWKLVE